MKARTFILVSALAISGCYRGAAHSVSASDVGREPGWDLVRDVRFIPQKGEHDCGIAALAMVLDHWGVPGAASPADIPGAGATADEAGVAAGALRDLARRRGLHAFLIQGEEADLVREVNLNRPVVVGLVQRYTNRSYAHFEVVTGINQRTRQVLMLDPGHGLREDAWASFATEWGGSGRLALVVGPN